MRSLRPSLAMAALVAMLFVRLLVPAGWMPADGASFAVMPCPSWAPIAATAAHDHGAAADHGDHKSDKNVHDRAGDCAFSPLSGSATVAGDVPLAPIAVSTAVVRLGSPRTAVWARGPPALPPPSTGPPLLA